MADATLPPPAWATRSGRIDPRPLGPGDWSPPALAARAQITDAFYRFGIGHDEGRSEVAASVMTEDVVYEVALGSGEAFTTWHGRAEVAERLAAVAGELQDQRRHLVSDVLVESLDVAAGTATAIAYGLVSVAKDGLFLGASVVYSAQLRRDPDGCWRFTHFFIGMDHFAGARPAAGEN